MKRLLRAEARLIAARKRGQYKGHRSSFRKMKRVFLTLTQEEKSQMTRREMSKMVNMVHESRRTEAERLANGKQLLDRVFDAGYFTQAAPSMDNAEFISEKGNVNVTLFLRHRERWAQDMSDLVAAIVEYNKHVPRREEVEYNTNWLDAGEMFVYLRKTLRKAK